MTDSRPNPPNLSLQSRWLTLWLLPVRMALAGVYWGVTMLRNRLYDWRFLKIKRVPAVVISVGNLSVGGSGKTLLVEALARMLTAEGFRVGIASRGYRRRSKGLQVVSDGEKVLLSAQEAGDEPFLLAQNLAGVPVMVGADKRDVGNALCERFGVEVILLDDGFQHRRLHRDLDVVILNRLPENMGHLLPWGNLRESRRGLQRADVIFYAKLPSGEESRVSESDNLRFTVADRLRSTESPGLNGDDLSGEKIGAFCGLGQPWHFFRTLAQAGISPVVELTFPDHCAYGDADRARIVHARVNRWVTTQKDFVKLPKAFVAEQQIYYLPVQIEINPEKWTEILARVKAAVGP
ncbi:MAG: tetraacyldisaccharide 4'-kinase [Lentisphaeria bacterium]|nr:tetraacyldisaccharide 4'-kinase [Candidatus Neomarinimicrobiota bacterium]MCF7842078.1 tetraacyldisaccharide 4'-kinase [Lentisphaeria bacterium]